MVSVGSTWSFSLCCGAPDFLVYVVNLSTSSLYAWQRERAKYTFNFLIHCVCVFSVSHVFLSKSVFLINYSLVAKILLFVTYYLLVMIMLVVNSYPPVLH